MSEKFQTKVGIFVFIGLILLAGLLISFSKGTLFVKPAYEINLKTQNVGGIKSRASVLMAGVPVGYVEDVKLTEDNWNVIIKIKILDQFKIRKGSKFVIEQSGFLGDQYIAIYPPHDRTTSVTTGTPLKEKESEFIRDGETIECEEPFNLQETARAAALFIKRVEDTVRKINTMIERIDTNLLTDQNFSNITYSLGNLSKISETTVSTVNQVETLLQTNFIPVNLTVSNLTHISSNLVVFLGELNNFAMELNKTLSTNEENITLSLKNVALTTASLTNLLWQLQEGKGIASAVLKDPELKTNIDEIVKNVDGLTANLNIASSNLNRFGLWWMLWKPKYPKTNVVETEIKREVKIPNAPIAPIPRRRF